MITSWQSIQDQGKTLCAVAQAVQLVRKGSYQPEEVYGNVSLAMPGSHFLCSDDMRQLMGDIVRQGRRHLILLIDEINRVYPARFWSDKERTMELLTIWQDIKSFMQIIYTTHVGNSVDLLVREATQFVMVPRYFPAQDLVRIYSINGLDMKPGKWYLQPASSIFKEYDRWAFVS